jgi:hypothetical protein
MGRVCIAILVFAVAAVECAPINIDELLQNIESAATAEAKKDNSDAAEYMAVAEVENKQIESNKHFGEKMSEQLQSQTTQLDAMRADEKQTIKDAKEIDADAKSDSQVMGIEDADVDALTKSEEIQKTAESVDASLLSSIDELRNAKAEGAKKAAEAIKLAKKKAVEQASLLGESQFPQESGTNKQVLQNIEERAKTMVSIAEDNKQSAEKVEEEAKQQLKVQSQMAKEGLAQLKKSEEQLHRDLNGHRDTELEQDIEDKAEDIESQQGTRLGESQPTALEAAEMAAESAVDTPQLDTSTEYNPATASREEKIERAHKLRHVARVALRAEHEAIPADLEKGGLQKALDAQGATTSTSGSQVSSSSVSDDYQAIDKDAEQLVAYQVPSSIGHL